MPHIKLNNLWMFNSGMPTLSGPHPSTIDPFCTVASPSVLLAALLLHLQDYVPCALTAWQEQQPAEAAGKRSAGAAGKCPARTAATGTPPGMFPACSASASAPSQNAAAAPAQPLG